MEGINTKLRVITRRAYGFRSHGALISMPVPVLRRHRTGAAPLATIQSDYTAGRVSRPLLTSRLGRRPAAPGPGSNEAAGVAGGRRGCHAAPATGRAGSCERRQRRDRAGRESGGSRPAAGCRRPRLRRGRYRRGDNNHESGRRPRRSLPERRRSGVEQRPRLVARVRRRVHPGRVAAARIAPGRAGVARCGAWVSRLKRGGLRGSGGDSPPAPAPLAIRGAGSPVPQGERRETPAGGGIPREKGNMTDERIDPIGSVTPEPTCTECRRRPRWADRCGANPAMSGSGLWTGRPRFPMPMARLGESAS